MQKGRFLEQPRTILVVDDDPDVLQAVEGYLVDQAYRVAKASRWTEAVAALQDASPDAVLLDLHLPTVQGEALLEFIRQTYSHLPVVIISTDISPAKMAHLSDLGASGFIRKPFETDELLVVLEQVLLDLVSAGGGRESAREGYAPADIGSFSEPPAPGEGSPLPSDVVPGAGVHDLSRRSRTAVSTASQQVDHGPKKRVRKKKKHRTRSGGKLKTVRNYALILVFFFSIATLIYMVQQGLNLGYFGGITVSKSVSEPEAP